MGLLSSLFGGHHSQGNRQLASSLASMIATSSLGIPIEESFHSSPAKRRAVVGFFFGFADFMGQAKGLDPDAVYETARLMFKGAFRLSGKKLDEIMELAVECSNSESGRNYMMKGAESIGKFMAKERQVPVSHNEFLMLMSDAEIDAKLDLN